MNNNELVYLCRNNSAKLDQYLSSGLISIAQYNQVTAILNDQKLKEVAIFSFKFDNPGVIDALDDEKEKVVEKVKEEVKEDVVESDTTSNTNSDILDEDASITKEELLKSILEDTEQETMETTILQSDEKKPKSKKVLIFIVLLILGITSGVIIYNVLLNSPEDTKEVDVSEVEKEEKSNSEDSVPEKETKKEDEDVEIESEKYKLQARELTNEQISSRDKLLNNSEIKLADIPDDLVSDVIEGVDTANISETYLAITPNKNYYIVSLEGEQKDTLIFEIQKKNGEIVAENGFTSEKLAYMRNESDEIGQISNMDYPEAVRDYKSEISNDQDKYDTLEAEYNKLKFEHQLFVIKDDANSKVTPLSSKLNVIDGYMYNKNIAVVNTDGTKYNSNIINDKNDLGLFGIASDEDYEVKDVLNSFFTDEKSSVNYVPIFGNLSSLGGDLSSSTFYYDKKSNQLLLFDASLDNVTDETCAEINYFTIDLDETYILHMTGTDKYLLSIQNAIDKASTGEMSKSDKDACIPILNVPLDKDMIEKNGWSKEITEL